MTDRAAPTGRRRESLIDAIDRLLDVGTAISGDAIIRLADVDLIHLDLRLLLAAVVGPPPSAEPEAAVEAESTTHPGAGSDRTPTAVTSRSPQLSRSEGGPGRAAGTPGPPEAERSGERSGERLDQGLGHLVVAVVELVRQLLERQAVRRMRAGTLDSQQLERLGGALQALEQRMVELREALGVTPSELDRAIGTVEQLLDSSSSDLEGAGASQRRVS